MSSTETHPAGAPVAPSIQPWVECPLPHLLDTSVLFKELGRLAKSMEPTYLLASAEAGNAILYVSANVAKEVPEKFEKIAASVRVPPASVEEAWWGSYSPYIRVVDAMPAADDWRRDDLVGADADDLPFADAVALMGPVLAFSEDKHLISRGLATDQWRDLPELSLRLTGVDFTLRVTPELTALAIGEAVRLARRHPRIAFGVFVVCALVLGPPGPQRLRLNRDRARSFALQLLRAFVHLLETRNRASSQIAARLIPGSGADAARAVVSILAREREPVSDESLLEQLREIDQTELAEILGTCPAVVKTADGWQLGRPVEPPSTQPPR